MKTTMNWQTVLHQALKRARGEDTPILVQAKYPASEWAERAFPYNLQP